MKDRLSVGMLRDRRRTVSADPLVVALGACILLVAVPSAVASATHVGPSNLEPAPPAGLAVGTWSEIQEQIQESEYEITWQDWTGLADLDRAWQAPNRAQNLRTYFTEHGIRVVRRTKSEPSWEWGLSLIGYGRREKVSPVDKAVLSPHENRIDYDRGPIIEWYVNDRRGLEQGFTLTRPPDELAYDDVEARTVAGRRVPSPGGPDENPPVFLVLELGGTLSPVISEDGQAIDFAAPGGARVLHYAQLKVTDARGDELPAWMEGFAEAGVRGIRIVFDDAEAVYPVEVDPLATSPAWTAEGDQEDAYFGFSLSPAGDVNGDGFADVIVGAYGYDNGETDEGRAFVYHGAPAGLSAAAVWIAEGNQAGADLGRAVSTAGDVNGDGFADVIVGARGYDNGLSNLGRVFVYHGSASGLSPSADWISEGDQAYADFGDSVSTAGDVNGDGYSDVIVEAGWYDNGETNEGRAYVYHGSASGLSATAAWTTEGDQDSACFGCSVKTAGDVNGDGFSDVIVGAPGYENGQWREGRAYVYHGSETGLREVADWTAESDQGGSSFGSLVSTAGDVNGDGYADVVVGSPQYGNGETEEGRAFVYHGSATGLSATASWTAESDQEVAHFGYSVSTAGDVNGDGYADVVVGALHYDNGETNEGRAYVYHGSAAGLSATADWVDESNHVSAWFGNSVSTAGDVNGDGYADILVGAYIYDNGEVAEGCAFVYHGSAAGLDSSPGWTVESNHEDGLFGWSVATAGDVNGDGYADVIIGAPDYDGGGRAFVYHGSTSGLSTNPDWTRWGAQSHVHFGLSVATAGDVNGDGYADVIIGGYHYDNGHSNEGRAFVYHGSAAGLSATADWTAEGNQVLALFGISVSTAGDVNGDGYADVIVGCYYCDNGQLDEGGAFVYHGSAAGLSTTADWTAEGNQVGANMGRSVSTAGDVNGDGYSDVIVGAAGYGNGEYDEGQAYVYHGSAAGLSATANWTAESNQALARLGDSVSNAGDVNGDGYADVIVGAYTYDNDDANEGRAYVYHGSAAGLSAVAAWTAEGDQYAARLGHPVETAGDLNGDGYADVIVGAYGYDVGEERGRVFVYHGSASGLSATPDWDVASEPNMSFDPNHPLSTAGDVNGDGYADIIVGFPLDDTMQGRADLYYGNEGPGLSLVPQQWQPSEDLPIAPLGNSDHPDGFRLLLRGRSPFGGGRAKLEWEVKPLGSLFNGSSTATSATWTELSGGAAQFSESVTGLAADMLYHWRVRLRYDGTSTPYQQFSRWVTVPLNGWNESDLRTLAEVDSDGDGHWAHVDCDDGDPNVWSTPGEAVSLAVAADKKTFSWDPPSSPGGVPASLRYDLLRSLSPDDFVAAACAATNITATEAIDTMPPFVPGQIWAYLVRAENACGTGSLGRNSAEEERPGRTCP